MVGNVDSDLRLRFRIEAERELKEFQRLSGLTGRKAAQDFGLIEHSISDADRALVDMETDFERFSRRGSRSTRRVRREVDQLGRSAQDLRGFLTGAFAAVGVGFTGRAVLDEIIQFEQGLVGIGKTANLQGPQLDRLGDDIIALGQKIPVPINRLLELGEVAGQLGVEGSANILKFVETMARLEASSDVSGAEGASQVARILTVTGEGIANVDRYASALVGLGNDSAATEGEINRITTQVAQSTAAYEVSAAEAAGLSAALASIGARAELSGSAVGRSIRAIDSALREGGQAREEFLSLAGLGGAEADALQRSNPVRLFEAFLTGLGRVIREGAAAEEVLARYGLEGEEILKILPTLAVRHDLVSEKLEIATREWNENRAAVEESERAYDTISGQLQAVANATAAVVLGVRDNDEALKDLLGTTASAIRILGDVATAEDRANDSAQALATSLGVAGTAVGLLAGASIIRAIQTLGGAVFGVAGGLGAVAGVGAAPIVAIGTAALGAGAFVLSMADDIAEMNRRLELVDAGRIENVEQAVIDVIEAARTSGGELRRAVGLEEEIEATKSQITDLTALLEQIRVDPDKLLPAFNLAELIPDVSIAELRAKFPDDIGTVVDEAGASRAGIVGGAVEDPVRRRIAELKRELPDLEAAAKASREEVERMNAAIARDEQLGDARQQIQDRIDAINDETDALRLAREERLALQDIARLGDAFATLPVEEQRKLQLALEDAHAARLRQQEDQREAAQRAKEEAAETRRLAAEKRAEATARISAAIAAEREQAAQDEAATQARIEAALSVEDFIGALEREAALLQATSGLPAEAAADFRQMADAVAQAQALLADTGLGLTDEQLGRIQQALSLAQRLRREAEGGASSPFQQRREADNQFDAQLVEEFSNPFGAFLEGLDESREEYDTFRERLLEDGRELDSALRGSLSGFGSDLLVNGFDDASEAAERMKQRIIRSMADIVASQAAEALLGFLGDIVKSLLPTGGGGESGGGGGGGLLGLGVLGLERGGVVDGPVIRAGGISMAQARMLTGGGIPGYARGRITNGPELAVIGEGRGGQAREVVLPLDSGDTVRGRFVDPYPVPRETGGGRPINVNLNVSALDAAGVEAWLRSPAARRAVTEVVGEAIASERSLRDEIGSV